MRIVTRLSLLIICSLFFVVPSVYADNHDLDASCQLSSVQWDVSEAVDGEVVSFTLTGTGSCDGQEVRANLFEDDIIGDDAALSQPGPLRFTDSRAHGTWVSQGVNDASGDSEWYIAASVMNSPQIVLSPLLSVKRSVPQSPPAITRLVLVDTQNQRDVRPLREDVSHTIVIGPSLPEFTIRAEATANTRSMMFTLDDVAYSVETTPPFVVSGDEDGVQLPWKLPDGTYKLSVQSFAQKDGEGLESEPYDVELLIQTRDNLPPTLDATVSPNPVTLGDPVYVSAKAADPDDVVQSVTFSFDGREIVRTKAPYDVSWIPESVGNYLVEVTAKDLQGGQTSQTRSFEVVKPVDTPVPPAPSLYFVSPRPQEVVEVGDVVTLQVSSRSPVPSEFTNRNIQYFANGAFIGSAPLDAKFSWEPTISGDVTLSAQLSGVARSRILVDVFVSQVMCRCAQGYVCDSSGSCVVDPSQSLIWVSPVSEQQFDVGETIYLQASSGSLSVLPSIGIEYLVNGVSVGVASEGSSVEFRPVSAGAHVLLARDVDTGITSSPRKVVVNNPCVCSDGSLCTSQNQCEVVVQGSVDWVSPVDNGVVNVDEPVSLLVDVRVRDNIDLSSPLKVRYLVDGTVIAVVPLGEKVEWTPSDSKDYRLEAQVQHAGTTIFSAPLRLSAVKYVCRCAPGYFCDASGSCVAEPVSTLNWVSPTDGAVVEQGSSFTLTTRLSALPTQRVASQLVSYFANNVLLATVPLEQSFTWTPSTSGKYSLTARLSNRDVAAQSISVVVDQAACDCSAGTVCNEQRICVPTSPPVELSLVSPQEGAKFSASTLVPMKVVSSPVSVDRDRVTVDFVVNEQFVGSALVGQTFSWAPKSSGLHVVEAHSSASKPSLIGYKTFTVYDNCSCTGSSCVKDPSCPTVLPPKLVWVYPAANSVITYGDTVPLRVNIEGNTVLSSSPRIQYASQGVIIGIASAKETFNWKAPVGTHLVQATLIDGGYQVSSSIRQIVVEPAERVQVIGLDLIDADSGEFLRSVTSGMTFERKLGQRVDVRARVSGPVQAVVFDIDGMVVRDTSSPFVAQRLADTSSSIWSSGSEKHEVSVYAVSDRSQSPVSSYIVAIVDPEPELPVLSKLRVVDSESGVDYPIASSEVSIPEKKFELFNVIAEPRTSVRSVQFYLDGSLVRTDSVAPFTLLDAGSLARIGMIEVAKHEIQAVPFSGVDGSGVRGAPFEVFVYPN